MKKNNGRYGKYGEIKRKDNLRKSHKQKFSQRKSFPGRGSK